MRFIGLLLALPIFSTFFEEKALIRNMLIIREL